MSVSDERRAQIIASFGGMEGAAINPLHPWNDEFWGAIACGGAYLFEDEMEVLLGEAMRMIEEGGDEMRVKIEEMRRREQAGDPDDKAFR